MTKKDMAKAIADRTGIPQTHVALIVQSIIDGITEILVSEGRIELRNFGVFEVRRRKARRGRNPRTGEAVNVPARMVVTFKAGKLMTKRVGRLAKVPNATTASAATSGIAT